MPRHQNPEANPHAFVEIPPWAVGPREQVSSVNISRGIKLSVQTAVIRLLPTDSPPTSNCK